MKKYKKKIAAQKKIAIIIGGIIVVGVLFFYQNTLLQFFQNKLSPLPNTNGSASIYSGILPCADCSGLETSLTLHPSPANPNIGTYTLKQIYQGKQVSPLIETGVWTTLVKTFNGKDATVYQMTTDKTNIVSYYLQLNNSELQLLDNQGNEIVTPFNITLTKQQ